VWDRRSFTTSSACRSLFLLNKAWDSQTCELASQKISGSTLPNGTDIISPPVEARTGSWRQTRSTFCLAWLATLMAGWCLLRLVLLFQFTPPAAPGQIVVAFLTGLIRDLLVGAWLTIPIFALLALIPRTRARWPHRLFWSACVLFWFGQFFLLFVEYFFFEEFRSRFNTVAVDYLQYPTEVFVNIWDSYHVGVVFLICLLLALAWTWAASRFFVRMFEVRAANNPSVRALAALVMLIAALTPLVMIAASLAGVMNSPLHLPPVHLSDERSLNEIADNGQLAFFTAALTHHLDYAQFYRTLPGEQAYQRTRDRLAAPGVHFVSRPDSLSRQVPGDSNRTRLNVVILLEESLGSEFWGCLGRTNSLTPEMDKLALEEGILFTNLYASGNRTVRGMEGVLASFPPLPGESIVKREFSDNVETIARLLKRDGYSTLFLYGGRGVFDGMRSFALRNSYDRFIEQKQFEYLSFTTIW